MVNWGDGTKCPYLEYGSGVCQRLKDVAWGRNNSGVYCDRKEPTRGCPLAGASESELLEVLSRRGSRQK